MVRVVEALTCASFLGRTPVTEHLLEQGTPLETRRDRARPVPGSWHNELHPAKLGFDAFATIFHDRLKQAFPGRVL
jgi:hypothetical protein